MSIIECVKVSIGALVSNKLRSVLTMLGVIIGVAAVISLVALGQGSQQSVESQISSLGTNLITLSIQRGGEFTADDMKSILQRVPTVDRATPVVSQSVTVKAGSTTYDTTASGVGESFPEVRNFTVQQGRFFGESDVEGRKKVAVLGYTVYTELFQGRQAVGQTVSIDGQPYAVIGVLSQKGSSMGQDSDDIILIPYTSAQRMMGTAYISQVLFRATSSDAASIATDHITRIMEEKFRSGDRNTDTAAQRPNPFRVFNQAELLKTVSAVTGTFTTLLAGVAAVSLLVGGIGIMNIMLVSVTERTREIGVRKALGARRADIMTQFLVESTVISGLGGVIGIAAGWGAAYLFSVIGSLKTSVSPVAAGVAFGFAAAIGIFFGIYPAQKAASMDPIVALRYE